MSRSKNPDYQTTTALLHLKTHISKKKNLSSQPFSSRLGSFLSCCYLGLSPPLCIYSTTLAWYGKPLPYLFCACALQSFWLRRQVEASLASWKHAAPTGRGLSLLNTPAIKHALPVIPQIPDRLSRNYVFSIYLVGDGICGLEVCERRQGLIQPLCLF